jgi:biopolymer transport protein ExbB
MIMSKFASVRRCAWVIGVIGLAGLVLTAFPSAVFAQEAANLPSAEHDYSGLGGFLRLIGPIGWLIFLLSFSLVALIVWLLLDLRATVAMPPDFVEAFEDAINKRRFKEAFELAKADQSMIGRVLTAGMTRLQHGLQEARDAATAMVDSLKSRKDHITAYMATIGTLGPLFGLVGTVSGMIKSFSVLGKGGTPNPGELALGISEALYLTLLGISLALPAIFFYSFFRNRMTRIAIDINLLADDLLTQMYHSSRSPAPPAPPGTVKSSPGSTATATLPGREV